MATARVKSDGSLALPDPSNRLDSVFRLLTNKERFACLGYMNAAALTSQFGKTHLRRGTGNAYGIPAVASIFVPVLNQVAARIDRSSLRGLSQVAARIDSSSGRALAALEKKMPSPPSPSKRLKTQSETQSESETPDVSNVEP